MSLAKAPPVPPPVRFAPLGCRVEEEEVSAYTQEQMMENRRWRHTPIGRESSLKEHVVELQIHLLPMGSQNGVEQFAGTLKSVGSCEKCKDNIAS